MSVTTPFEDSIFEEKKKKWEKKCKKYSTFCSVLFLPHPTLYGDTEIQDMPDIISSLAWDSFCKSIQRMDTSKKLIDRLRLDTMYTYMYGLRSNYERGVLFQNFRHRTSTKWSEEEKKEAKKLFDSIGIRNSSTAIKMNNDIGRLLLQKTFPKQKIRGYKNEILFCQQQLQSLKSLHNNTSIQTIQLKNDQDNNFTQSQIIQKISDPQTIKKIADNISHTQLS